MMPNNIPITIEDIAEIAQSFDCDFSDTHRQEALQCKICRDIQACPGSGKTTLLVAKLSILSKKWGWKDRGICVLSHTNVARQEVEKRIASHPTAYSLLSYPHFIGTIQVFVNRFLALPYLRNRGVEAPTVDNYRHKERILKVLERRKYSAIQTTFSNRRNAEKLLGNLRLEFVDGHFIVGSSAGNLGLKDKSKPTYTQLEELKRNLWREQLFRYDEMYSIAWAYLDEYPRFVDALRFRFPWVFIDEMQDTDTVQEDLLTHIFSDDSIVQRFGDVNQAIFKEMGKEGAQIHFPSPDSILLPDSKRFGKCIANFASQLTAVESQTIQGNLDRADGPHSVFLFDNDTISQVLPAFGHLIIDKYSERIPRTLPIKAFGGRKSPSDKPAPSKFPYCIGDFWPDFCPEATTKSNVPTSFIGYVREARDDLLKRQQWHVAYGLLFDGILDFLRRQQARNDEGRRFTRTRLADALRCEGQIHFHRLQKLLLELGSRQEINEQYWERTKTVLIDVLSPVIDKSTTPNAKEFLQWVDVEIDQSDEERPSLREPINIYQFEEEGVTVDIEVTTIHAVKGETHFATLILETFWRKHDLPELVPFLIDQQDCNGFEKMSKKRAKRIFVGMTRPRELLCLAINKQHLQEDQIRAMSKNGWIIQDLTTDYTKIMS